MGSGIRDGKNSDPGPGMEKNSHPRSGINTRSARMHDFCRYSLPGDYLLHVLLTILLLSNVVLSFIGWPDFLFIFSSYAAILSLYIPISGGMTYLCVWIEWILIGRYFDVQVVHDCRNDAAALYYQYDISIKNVFDTQVTHHFWASVFLCLFLTSPFFCSNADFELAPSSWQSNMVFTRSAWYIRALCTRSKPWVNYQINWLLMHLMLYNRSLIPRVFHIACFI